MRGMVLTVPLPKNDRDGTGAWRHCPYRYRRRCCRLASSISSAALGRSHARWSGSRQRQFLVSRAAYAGIAPGSYTLRRQREQDDEERFVAD